MAWEIKPKPVIASSGNKMLEVELFVYADRLLVGKVVYQDESLRSNRTLSELDSGFRIQSGSGPEMSSDTLYIRGSIKESDNNPMCYLFRTPEDLMKYVCNIKKAIAKINNTTKPEEVPASGKFRKVL